MLSQWKKQFAVPHDWNKTANAAGGILSNITDMTTWANFLMNGFVTKDGVRFWFLRKKRKSSLANSTTHSMAAKILMILNFTDTV